MGGLQQQVKRGMVVGVSSGQIEGGGGVPYRPRPYQTQQQ